MEIAILDKRALRVKSRNSTIIIDPNLSTAKIESDAILILKNRDDFSDKKIINFRILIKGPGEYEVGGTKISCIKMEESLIAKIDVDSVKVVVGEGQSIEKIQDRIDSCDILVINSDSVFNNSLIASLEPKVVLIYGEQKEEVAKSLGIDNPEKVSKYSSAFDKLPDELHILLLEN